MINTRAIAMDVLLAWQESQEPLDLVLEQECARAALGDPRDRHFLMALVYGVVRWQGYLDGIIADFSSHPLTKMKPLTLAALRVGLQQLLFMDRVPESAAINETVRALKEARQPKWLTGFVNALLRTAARRRKTLPPADAAAAVRSHPEWLVARWLALYGRERMQAICAANNREAGLCLRVNTKRISVPQYLEVLASHGIAATPGAYAPAALRLPDDFRGGIAELPGYGQGYFQVQDEAAQLACHLLAPFAPGACLDGCAGLGGKTVQLAWLLPEGTRLVAVEPNARRLALLRENLARLGEEGVELVASTLEEYAAGCRERFSAILIDAPCSGLGVIRRQPDIRWQRSLAILERNRERQGALLAAAAPLLAPGGVLVYATCSIEPMENEEVVARFLQEQPGFSLTDAREYLPSKAQALGDETGFFRTTPEQGLDGFFAARLQKIQ